MSRQLTHIALVLGVVFGVQQAEGQSPSKPYASDHCPRPAPRHAYGVWAGPYGYHSSTAAEGYARGMAAVIWAKGQYNLATSEAMINRRAAEKQQIANHKQGVENYFALRETNRAARAAERGPRTPLRTVETSQAQVNNSDRAAESSFDPFTGKIAWPELLRRETYDSFRSELEHVYAQRSPGSGFSSAQKERVAEVANAMLTELKEHIREHSTGEYLAARRFLTRLASEA